MPENTFYSNCVTPSEYSLSKKVVHGGLWVFARRATERAVGLIRTIVLARLLAPSDFGLFGVAMLALSILEVVSQTRFHSALIQKKNDIESYLDVAWTYAVARGILLFLILSASAPAIATFFNSPGAIQVVRVIALSSLVAGFQNIGTVYFQRNFQFNKQFVCDIAATVTNMTIAVILAISLRNGLALAYGFLGAEIARLFLSYLLHPYRPKLRFETAKFKDLLDFGKWALSSSIIIFLVTQGDDIVVGKMLGVGALGLYQMAYLISHLPATEIGHAISQVTFPAYSRLQDDLPRLRKGYLAVLHFISFASMPLGTAVMVLIPDFTRIFLGEKWLPMVPATQVLVLAGLTRAVAATAGPVFYGIGKPKIETRWELVRFAILAGLIFPFVSKWGLLGASVAVLLSMLVATIGVSFSVIRITECSARHFGKLILLPLLNATLMASIIIFIRGHLTKIEILQFVFLLGCGAISYLLLTYVFDHYFDYGIRRLIVEKVIQK